MIARRSPHYEFPCASPPTNASKASRRCAGSSLRTGNIITAWKLIKEHDLQEAQRLFAASHAANPGDNRTLLQVSDS